MVPNKETQVSWTGHKAFLALVDPVELVLLEGGVGAEPLHACDRLVMSDAMAHDSLLWLHDGAIDHDKGWVGVADFEESHVGSGFYWVDGGSEDVEGFL